MSVTLRRRFYATCTALLLVGLAACEDSPSEPGVYTHPADGQLWVALDMPFGTPTLRTWLPYVRPDHPAADSALAALRELRMEADRLRRNGAVTEANTREAEAMLLAARSLTRTPPPHVLLTGMAALEVWSDKAEGVAEWGQFADMKSAAAEVRSRRAAATEALEHGDTAAAAVELAEAGVVVSSMAPAAVADRLLVHAESRLAERAAVDADAERALRLLRHAREALADGDEVRALRRALYALQLADGKGAPSVDPRDGSDH